jgi:hypothetical protein
MIPYTSKEEKVMKISRSIMIMFVIGLLLGGCSTPIVRPDYCVDKPSLIYDTAEKLKVDPSTINQILVIGNMVALKKNAYGAQQVITTLNTLETLLSQKPTYAMVISVAYTYIDYVNRYCGESVLVASAFLPFLNKDIPISDCDRQLILYHIQKQKEMIRQMFGNQLPQA